MKLFSPEVNLKLLKWGRESSILLNTRLNSNFLKLKVILEKRKRGIILKRRRVSRVSHLFLLLKAIFSLKKR